MSFDHFFSKYVPKRSNYLLLKSFSDHDFKSILKMECPIPFPIVSTVPKQIEANKTIISTSKKLRSCFKIEESKICFSCSKKMSCPSFEKVPKIDNPYEIYFSDVQYYLHHMYLIESNEDVILHKSDSMSQHQVKLIEEQTQENFGEIEVAEPSKEGLKIDLNFNFTPKTFQYDAAKRIADNIYYILDDIIYSQGAYVKSLENEYLKSKLMKTESTVSVSNSNINEIDDDFDRKNIDLILSDGTELSKIQEDPRKLISLFKKTKNQKEKRILLAKFNQAMRRIPIEWGKHQKISSTTVSRNSVIFEDIESDKQKKPEKRPINDGRTENSVYQNTTQFSKRAIERTSKSPELLSIGKLNKQVNKRNQEKITFENEVKINSLGQSEEYSQVQIPGKEVKMAIDYVRQNSNEQMIDLNRSYIEKLPSSKVEAFKKNLNDHIEKKAVNITEEVNKNKSKFEKQLDSTVHKSLNTLNKEIDQIKDKEKRIKSMIDSGKLLNKNPEHFAIGQSNSEIISVDRTPDLQMFERKVSLTSLPENSTTQPEQNITYEIQSSIKDSNFEMIKQVNKKRDELIKVKQEKSKLNAEIKNKDKYAANNFYNKDAETTIQYERDLDIQKTLRFEKTIKPSKKLNK